MAQRILVSSQFSHLALRLFVSRGRVCTDGARGH
jgi:hypothetical protein